MEKVYVAGVYNVTEDRKGQRSRKKRGKSTVLSFWTLRRKGLYLATDDL